MSKETRGDFNLNQSKEGSYTHGKSWFLGIGINEYKEFRDLSNAVKDITDFRSLLIEKYDFGEEHTTTLFNKEADEENIIDKLEHLAEHTAEDDKVIIYYSGHGKVDKWGDGYWLPHDAKQGSTSRYISNSTIRDKIRHIKARHILLIADSCFSGSLLQEGESRSSFSAIEELEAIPSRWAICSGRGDEEVFDGVPGSNSPFTESILNMLRNNMSSAINIVKLFDRVMEVTRANYAQLPQGRPMLGVGHKGGQYVFRPKTEDDKNLWKKAEAAGTIEEVQTYLATFPEGHFAGQAKQLLYSLKDEKAWQDASEDNDIGAYFFYLKTFKQGKYREKAQTAIDKLTPKITSNPSNNPESEKIREELDALKENLAWEQVLTKRTIEVYEDFLKKFPKGNYSKTALDEVKKLKPHVKKEKETLFNGINQALHFETGFFAKSKRKTNFDFSVGEGPMVNVKAYTEREQGYILFMTSSYDYDFSKRNEQSARLEEKGWTTNDEITYSYVYELKGEDNRTISNWLYDTIIYVFELPSECETFFVDAL